MKVFAFEVEDKCPMCNWDTSHGYVIAKNEEEAKQKLKEEGFSCGSCLAEKIACEEYVVTEKEFNPDDYPDVYFPNWFEKEHFEMFVGRELADEEFEKIKEGLLDTDLANEVTEITREFVKDIIYEKVILPEKNKRKGNLKP